MICYPTSIPPNRSRMALDYQNSPELSGMSCPKCKEHLTTDEEYTILTQYFIDHKCGRDLYVEDVKVKVLPRYQHLLNLDKAQDQPFWYHATNVQEWPKVQTLLPVNHWLAHIGSKESALDRANHQKYTLLYKVVIDPDALWSPCVTDDWNEWPTHEVDLHREVFYNFSEVTRYVNRYEIPGSISLLVASKHIRVVGCEEIPKPNKEIHRDSATRQSAVPCP